MDKEMVTEGSCVYRSYALFLRALIIRRGLRIGTQSGSTISMTIPHKYWEQTQANPI